MNSRIKMFELIALCHMVTLLTGCFPEDGLEWSADGSVGLLRIDGALCLIDGQSDQTTPVQIDGQAAVMPDISADGKQIAYVRDRPCSNIAEGLKAFSPIVTRRVKHDAQQLAEKILAGAVFPQDLPAGETVKASREDTYHVWVVRTMVDEPSPELTTRIGADKLAECRQCELTIHELIVADRMNPGQGKILTSMPSPIYRPRFSPNKRHVAYLVTEPVNKEKAWLAVTAVAGGARPMQVAKAVALGYDWRPDGKALGYIKQDGDEILAVVKETVVLDANDAFVASEVDPNQVTEICPLCAATAGQQFAGTLYDPTMRVQYGPGDRLLFSSASAQIPTSDLDEPQYSLFCYDRLMGTVTSILPSTLQNQASATMNFFSLSPDRKRVLVPLPSNRFAIYELGTSNVILPIEEDEGFGEDELPQFSPQWKGNDQVTCLVSENSHFLVGDDGQPHGRREIVVLDLDGKLLKVLSTDWFDDALPSTDG